MTRLRYNLTKVMQSVWKKTETCRKICEWAINAGSIAMSYDMQELPCRIHLRVDVTFCRLTELLSVASYSNFKSENLSFIIA